MSGKKIASKVLHKIRAKMNEEVENLDEGLDHEALAHDLNDIHQTDATTTHKLKTPVKNIQAEVVRGGGLSTGHRRSVPALKDYRRGNTEIANISLNKGHRLVTDHEGGHSYGYHPKHGHFRIDNDDLSNHVDLDSLREECDMTDTALSDVKPSAKGEVYSKASETTTAPTKPTGTKTGVTSSGSGEAYNTTPATKRLPAVEHAVRGIMERTYQIRKIHAEAAEISIGTPEQRQDWMNVEQGKMDVVQYFNKYKITGDE